MGDRRFDAASGSEEALAALLDAPRMQIPFKRYELVERIGLGGMAEVYRANGITADGTVLPIVVKKILPSFSGDDQFRQMFIDEARITAHLEHPNLVQLLDLGRMDEQLFLALELVEGIDLQRLLAKLEGEGKRLPFADAAYVMTKVLEGLEYAHRRTLQDGTSLGIVHRDVSPGNVLLARDGTVKLTDFGIAKGAVRGGHTMVGAIKGNLRYIAPEQITAGAVGPWSDTYACGMVLFRMVLGRYPIDFDALGTLVGIVVDGTVPRPYELDPQIPPELDAIVSKAISRDSAARFAHARDFQDALVRWARESGHVLSPHGVAGAVAAHLARDAKTADKTKAVRVVSVVHKQSGNEEGGTVYKSQSVTALRNPFEPEVVDADVEEVTRKSLVRRPRPTKEITNDFTTTDEVRPPFARGLEPSIGEFVIPDDIPILGVPPSTTRHGATLIEERGGASAAGVDEEERTAPTPIPRATPPAAQEERSSSLPVPNLASGEGEEKRSWEPDLDSLGEPADLPAPKAPDARPAASAPSFNIPVMAAPPAPAAAPPPPQDGVTEAESTRPTQIPGAPAPRTEDTVTHKSAASTTPPAEARAIATMAIGGFMGHKEAVSGIAIAPSSRYVATASHDGTVRIWDPATRREVRNLQGHEGPVTCVGISPDGRYVASAGHDKTLRVWEPISGSEAFRLGGHQDWILSVSWSHDGRRIVSSSADRTVRVWDIAERRELFSWSGHAGIVTQARFLPSWMRQVISVSYDATLRLWSLADGSELRSLGAPKMEGVRALAVSPEGEYAFSGGADSLVRVWDLATGSAVTLAGHTGAVAALASPDGNVLGSASHDGTVKIWDVSARREMKSLRGHRGAVKALCFSPDGRYLLSGGDDKIVAIWQLGL